MLALGLDRIASLNLELFGRAVEQCNRRGRDQLLGRRREVARIAEVDRCERSCIPDEIGARAQLRFFRERPHRIEARAIVERQRPAELPLVLEIDAIQLAGLVALIGDSEGHVARLERRAVTTYAGETAGKNG